MHNSFSCNPVSKYNSALSFCSVSCAIAAEFFWLHQWFFPLALSLSGLEWVLSPSCWQNLCLLKTHGTGTQGHSGISWISLPVTVPDWIWHSTAAPAWESFSYFNSRCSETIHVFWERRHFTIYNYMTVWASYWRSLMRIWGGSKLPGNEGRCSLEYYYYL